MQVQPQLSQGQAQHHQGGLQSGSHDEMYCNIIVTYRRAGELLHVGEHPGDGLQGGGLLGGQPVVAHHLCTLHDIK